MPPSARLPESSRGRLLIACPDQPGIIASVSRFLFDHNANIVHSDQHATRPVGGRFFQRIEFALPNLEQRLPDLGEEFGDVAARYNMEWRIALASHRKRLAIFVSREPHCLLELLWQQQAGDLDAEIGVIISNHDDLRPLAASWQIPYFRTSGDGEAQQVAILRDFAVDLVVLARYMQILSVPFVELWQGRIINIHHSFLPAFAGARPYAQAYARGVKLIGATAHYVTAELDAGPIIEQDTERVDHRHSIDDLKRIGRQIERTVLARAVSWHVADRVLLDGDKTVVFR